MSKVERVNIEEVLTNAAKEAADTSVAMRGRESAFKDMIKFFKDNNLEVIKETPDTPEEPAKEEAPAPKEN